MDSDQIADYSNMAKKIILNFCVPGVAHKLLIDDDVITDITIILIKADLKWNISTRRTLRSHRYQHAIWFIQKYLKHQSKRYSKYLTTVPLNTIKDFSNKRYPNPSLLCMQQELMRLLHEFMNQLQPKEKQILKMHFFDYMTYQDIGAQYNISRQRVHQIIDKSIKKLREMAHGV